MQQSFQAIKRLVADFKAQEAAYLSPSYQESQVRQDFIDKFFTALGWDVTHERQKNPYEQEVHIENKVKMAGSSQRRADYAFYLGPNFRDPKFFVEAKKPSRNLANADDYYQAIRYGWNAKTPLAILTDFEEFHILDCRFKPDINDALNRKVASFHYTDYADNEKFAYINYLFSRDAVAAGAIEKRATELPKPRGKGGQKGASGGAYQAVDEAFLEELDEYRITLAKAFKKANEKLEGEELTEAVQRTIDRLVFIRFLEDKGIEEKAIINLKRQKSAWKAFINLCKRCEPKYNGLVFKPHRILDNITLDDFEDKAFAQICAELADPGSPYDFNQIPISILGSIYERFLGKVVHATDKRVKVEDKPEVRKAGGVYYTPEYIVRYIVKETVGKLIEGKNPAEIVPMAFADIACGSGSFLIEVYAQLLDHHVRYYLAHPDKAKTDEVFERDGQLHLSLKKKKEILLNNIYGVDIDFQATEVTQLSLYLKLLEDATLSDAHQFGLFKETILPDLKHNIVCGNSLVGKDIMTASLFPSIDETKLKPMNYRDVFPEVMKRGGFDVVVGNPPYVRGVHIRENSIETWEVLRSHYRSAGTKEWDLYLVFVEKAERLIKTNGQLGFILPNKFLNSQVGENLRAILSERRRLKKLVHFGAFQIFSGVTTYTCLLFLEALGRNVAQLCRYTGQVIKAGQPCPLPEEEPNMWSVGQIANTALTSAPWELSGTAGTILEKLRQQTTLENYVRIYQGTGTRADKVFLLELLEETKQGVRAFSQETNQEVILEKTFLKPALRGKSVSGYEFVESNLLLLVPYRIVNGKPVLVTEKELGQEAPRTLAYLRECKKKLVVRENGRFAGENWFCYGRPQNMNLFELTEKIVLPDISNGSNFSIDRHGRWLLDTLYGMVKRDNVLLDLRYLLGILNSSVLTSFLKETGTALRGGYFRAKTAYLNPFPIPQIDFTNKVEQAKHDRLVELVEQMMRARENVSIAKTDAEKNRIELQCESLDRQIDEAVYELYGLTEEEIKIVEKAE